VDAEADTGSKLLWRKMKSLDGGGWILVLGIQGRAVLLQHQEINQARRSSLMAIIISILALLAVLVVGYYKINQSKQSHSEEIIELKDVNSNLIRLNDSILKIHRIRIEKRKPDSLKIK